MEVNEKLVAVYTGSTPGQADVAKLTLEEAGIQAVLMNDSLHGIHGFASVGAHALPSVMVKESDQPAAQEIMDQLTKDPGFLTWSRKQEAASAGEPAEKRNEPTELVPWPHCPACQKPRVTVCPICATSGTEFPRADANFALDSENSADAPNQPTAITDGADAAVVEQRLALICTTCDEPWSARFLRRCEWCGHDFGVGLRMDKVPRQREVSDPLNSRALLLLALIGGSIVAGCVWLWSL